jgi:hypothetical protein
VRGVKEAIEMGVQGEYPPIIYPEAFPDCVAPLYTTIKYADLSLVAVE